MADENVEPIIDNNSVATPENIINMDDAAALMTQEQPSPEEAPKEEPREQQEETPEIDEDELIFGSSVDAETDAEPEQSEEELIEVKANGETLEVTLDELKQGYSRHQDYTRKTQEVSEQAKALEAEKARLAQETETHRQQMQAQLEIVSKLGPQPTPPDISMLDENSENWNPDAYNKQKAHYDLAIQEYEKGIGVLEAQQKEAAEAQAKAVQDWEAQQAQIIQEHWPETRNAENLEVINRRYAEYLTEMGLSVDEMNMIKDARMKLIIRDAMKGRAFEAKRSKAAKKVQGVPKVQKPGTKREPGSDIAERRAAILEKAERRGEMTPDEAVSYLVAQ